jgi:hypothetical protein
METLRNVLFKYLPLDAHYTFDERVSQVLASSSSSLLSTLGTLPQQFNAALAEEREIIDWVKKSVLTDKIAEADRAMDRSLTAIKSLVRAQEYSSNTTIADAARRVYVMLKGYGTVNRKSYESQEGDMRAILRQLQSGGAYYNDANTLGLGTLVNELQSAFTAFLNLLKQRDDKSLQKPDKTSKEVRQETDSIYLRIAKLVNAGAELNPTSTVYSAFINALNPEIDRLNAEFHPVKSDISTCEPEPIPQQMYTGRPLTPTPRVLYVTPHDGTIQLELGKDYNLTFRHNIEVGNAECTIHGKGKYKGRKTVTFIIIRTS